MVLTSAGLAVASASPTPPLNAGKETAIIMKTGPATEGGQAWLTFSHFCLFHQSHLQLLQVTCDIVQFSLVEVDSLHCRLRKEAK